MRLELAEYPVSQVRLAGRTRYDAGTLEVEEEELLAPIRRDGRILEASLAVAPAGERVRITHVRDVVEPRVKVEGPGQVFPGVLGPVVPVGAGRTHRLSGMAVVVAGAYEGTIRAGTGVQRSCILDTWGPGAESSRFGPLASLVLSLRLAPGLPELEAHDAMQQASYQVARRLAEATSGQEPPRVETYELSDADPSLPRVVLIQGCLTHTHHPHSGLNYYGVSVRDSLATVVHPNELLDGALTVDATRGIGYYPTTWDWQNHPLVSGLYREHGRRLHFAGVILARIRYETYQGKEVVALNTAQLASTLGADAALVTWYGSGNAFVDLMLTVQACESRGIKTVLVTYEYGGKDGVDSPLLYYVPEADAVVSVGSRDRWLELPAPDRVVGPGERISILTYPGAPEADARDPLTLDARDMLAGGVDIWGRDSWTCQAY